MRWIGLVVSFGLLGQFAYAQPTGSAQKRPYEQKKVAAQAILQQVGATYGFGVLELPKLVVHPKRPGNKHIVTLELAAPSVRQAANSLDRSRLIMDEEVFDICQAVDPGGSALAFVLAHEMAHFYRRHATFRSFAGPGDRPAKDLLNARSLRQEKEADETGLLFAYLAGYDPGPKLNALFDALYDQYTLKDSLPGHPAKADRQRATNLRTSEFRTYGYLFAVGHALYCREKFAEAARCFEYVYARYPLKEAYANFGTCRLQEAVRLKKNTPTSYFALPFEVDPRNRLLRMGERGETTTTDITNRLKEAKAAFEQAIAMDNRYQLAYLNQAISELLAENPYAALGILNTLKTQTGPTLPPNGYLLQAFAHQALNDRANADASMKIALSRNAYQAGYNAYVFQAIRKGTVTTLRQPWQRLSPRQSAFPALGCQAGTAVLLEIDAAPATIRWVDKPLIDLTNPPPFIGVDYGQTGTGTYFRVRLQTEENLFFRLKR